ncbi:DUF2752 domain-containing protein [Planctomicrobium sp. SH661]|uniref:DUF2752 domain-containing protein n=1 Tax=Planctomicrobium sp. SH661 TaxID=3448124 RepID=UPI003F5BCB30
MPLSQSQRLVLCLISLMVLGGFLACLLVTPDPRGFGSHQQLGLPPCLFKILFGLPCPGCGGTTSFAHFVRGQWISSLRANAAGFAAALIGLMFVFWGLLSSLQGRLIRVHSPLPLLSWILTFLSVITLVQWIARLMAS